MEKTPKINTQNNTKLTPKSWALFQTPKFGATPELGVIPKFGVTPEFSATPNVECYFKHPIAVQHQISV